MKYRIFTYSDCTFIYPSRYFQKDDDDNMPIIFDNINDMRLLGIEKYPVYYLLNPNYLIIFGNEQFQKFSPNQSLFLEQIPSTFTSIHHDGLLTSSSFSERNPNDFTASEMRTNRPLGPKLKKIISNFLILMQTSNIEYSYVQFSPHLGEGFIEQINDGND